MVQLRHVGIYTRNLEMMTAFYKQAFNMHMICENVIQSDALIKDLLHDENAAVKISKLITEQGKINGYGDMVELIAVDFDFAKQNTKIFERQIFDVGCTHTAFYVNDINETVKKIIALGGEAKTKIHEMPNGAKCCFCVDPEKNWLELIQR